MTKEEAIKYLQQIYPNGGHCWLDEQRIEAIGIAINALREEPASKLTWQDIQRIVKVADQIVDEDEDGRLLTMSEDDYYKEVLERYMETIKE